MRRIAGIVLGRTGRTVICLLGQLLILSLLLRLCGPWVRDVLWVLSLAAVVGIVAGQSEAGYKTAWCILVLALPVFGLMCYALLGSSKKNRRLRQLHRAAQPPRSDNGGALAKLWQEAPAAAAQAEVIFRLCGSPVWYGGQAKWLPSGEAVFRAMLVDIRQAKKSIWLEYFIIRPGVMWDTILMHLRQKAAAGVEVRLIYDDLGSVCLPRSYPKRLKKMHIQAAVFNPFTPELSARLGSRDHRKLTIIDGRVCYTGGVNLSDEYIGVRQRFGQWKDGAVRIEGAAVATFSTLFAAMWTALRGQTLVQADPGAVQAQPYCYMQPFWDSPLSTAPVGRSAIAALIARAEKSIWLMTPYFVPDTALTQALCLAARSGVEVRIMTPGMGDKWYTQALTRAHYPQLLEAGAEIFEYTPGFLHTKLCCADGHTAVVGTVNLDYRSFYLQFEDALWLYGVEAVAEIAADFRETLPLCRRITPESCAKTPWPRRAGRAILRMFAPLI